MIEKVVTNIAGGVSVLHGNTTSLFTHMVASLYGTGSEVAISVVGRREDGQIWAFDSWQSGPLDFNLGQVLNDWVESLAVREVIVNQTSTEDGEPANEPIFRVLNHRLPKLRKSVVPVLEPYAGLIALAEVKDAGRLNTDHYHQRDRLDQMLKRLSAGEVTALPLAFLQGVVKLSEGYGPVEFKTAGRSIASRCSGYL